MANKITSIETQATIHPVPDYDDNNYVVVDNGFAEQKIAYWYKDEQGERKIHTMTIPSRATDKITYRSVTTGKGASVYETNGSNYTVSEDLEKPIEDREKSYAFSELNRVLVNHSLLMAGFSGKKVTLATGLPFSHYYDFEGEPNDAFIKRVKDCLKGDIKVKVPKGADEVPMAIITQHHVYPESTAAFFDFAFDIDSETIRRFPNGIMIIDMGGNTTDISTISGGEHSSIVLDRSASIRLGVMDIRQRLVGLLEQAEASLDGVPARVVDLAIRGEAIEFFSQEEVGQFLKKAKKPVADDLFRFITSKSGTNFRPALLFVGGGANVLQDEFLAAYEKGVVPEKPQQANARGMLKHMTFLA